MDDSQFNAERATNGLVLALFLAAAIFLVVMLIQVLGDIDRRRVEEASSQTATPRVQTEPAPAHL